MKQVIDRPLELDLSTEEMQLIQAGLRLLLVVEDDRITIEQLKQLLARVESEVEASAN
jgi:hypothetical protein